MHIKLMLISSKVLSVSRFNLWWWIQEEHSIKKAYGLNALLSIIFARL